MSPSLNLNDPALLRHQTYWNGQWTGASSGETFAVKNPADGCTLGTVPDMDAHDTERAIAAAEAALPAWRERTSGLNLTGAS